MVELKDEVLEGATGGASGKAKKEDAATEVRKQQFLNKCKSCWYMGKKCKEKEDAKESGWTVVTCPNYKKV